MACKIFLSYRRGDDPGFAQALFGLLEKAFPPEQLFMDVDDIAPGLDFVKVLDEQVRQCDVVLALIGRDWLDAKDAAGRRRLDNSDDSCASSLLRHFVKPSASFQCWSTELRCPAPRRSPSHSSRWRVAMQSD
jgi:TIR domain